jgi:hypothetical protein
VFVHPSILDTTAASSPDAQQCERISAAMTNPAPHEKVLSLYVHANDVGREAWQLGPYFLYERRFKHLVGVEPA